MARHSRKRSRALLPAAAVLALLIFFIYQVYHLVTVSIDLKKALAVENIQENAQADSLLADAERAKEEAAKAKAEAEAAKKEAEAALAEAKRLREEAEKQTEVKDEKHE